MAEPHKHTMGGQGPTTVIMSGWLGRLVVGWRTSLLINGVRGEGKIKCGGRRLL